MPESYTPSSPLLLLAAAIAGLALALAFAKRKSVLGYILLVLPAGYALVYIWFAHMLAVLAEELTTFSLNSLLGGAHRFLSFFALTIPGNLVVVGLSLICNPEIWSTRERCSRVRTTQHVLVYGLSYVFFLGWLCFAFVTEVVLEYHQ